MRYHGAIYQHPLPFASILLFQFSQRRLPSATRPQAAVVIEAQPNAERLGELPASEWHVWRSGSKNMKERGFAPEAQQPGMSCTNGELLTGCAAMNTSVQE